MIQLDVVIEGFVKSSQNVLIYYVRRVLFCCNSTYVQLQRVYTSSYKSSLIFL